MTDQPSGWVRWLAPWVLAHRRAAVAALSGAVVGMVATTFVPLVQKLIIDDVVVAKSRALAPLLIALGGIGLVRFAATTTRRLAGGSVAYRVQEDLRNAVFDRLVELDFAQHDRLPAGQLVSRANTDVNLVFSVMQMVAMVAGNLVMLIVSFAIMVLLSPLLAAVSTAAIIVTFVAAWHMRHAVYVSTWDSSQREADMTTVAEEAISGVRVVKGFGQEDRELSKFTAALERLFGGRVRNVRIKARFTAILQTVPTLAQVAVLAVGGWMALHGRVTIGTLLAFFAYLTQLAAPARMLAVFLAAAQQAKAGSSRLRALLDTEPTLVDAPGAVALDDVVGRIEFDAVTFAYGGGRDVLQDFTLTIEPGEHVALVGASGSGKSTATLLVPRFYDVSSGSVRVDGHDVRLVERASLRDAIGTVFEEAFLFSGSLRDNIAYGAPGATDHDVERAARAAQAHQFVSALPDGYETAVGEAGITLSGGQRQRIALARTLLQDPAIMILDDATSDVDAKVEDAIHDALATYLEGRTTLIVAHRISTLRLAHRIVVVDRGEVVDTGTHAELMERNAYYRSLLSVIDEDLDAVQHAEPPVAAEPHTPALDELASAVAALPPIRDRSKVDPATQRPDRGGLAFGAFTKPWRVELGVAVGLVALDSLATLAIPVLVRAGIDRGIVQGASHLLWAASGIALVIVIANIWTMWMENLVAGRAAERMLVALRIRLFAQLQRLGLDFYEREKSGTLLSRLTSDVDTLTELLQSGLINAAMSVAMLIGMVVVLLLLSVPLALAVFAVTAPLIVATMYYQRRSRPTYDRQRNAVAGVLADLQESLSGVRVIQATGQQARARSDFHDFDAEFRNAGLASLRVQVGYFVFVEFLSIVGVMVVLGLGAHLHDQGTLTVGVLIAFLLYLTQFFGPIQQMSQVFDTWQSAAAGVRKLDGLLSERASVPDPTVPASVEGLLGNISLQEVHFSYGSASSDVLHGISLQIPAGQRVAIVGETGSGKSTLVKLVARFYDPTHGMIVVDRIDIRSFHQSDYRQRLGYVPQEPFLFADTVRANLSYGDPGASEAAIQSAIDAVGVRDLIGRLPGGLDHHLAERGRSLSTGERQLLCLTRALVADPIVLLLDEATSNLDVATEARIEAAMDLLSRGRTSLVIAHRLTTAARADRVIVMDAGEIVQDGAHSELVQVPGPYAALWEAHGGLSVARHT